MAPPLTAADFRALVERSGLLSAAYLDPYFSDPADPEAAPDRLVQDRLLTPFQARQLRKGRADGFFLTDKYKILDLVGSGGMGKVYLAEHLLLHRLVAVKLVHPPPGARPRAARGFEPFSGE